MKLTLIKPNIGKMEDRLYVDEGRMEPLQLGVIAGLTPRDVDIELIDDRMESIPYDKHTDLVAITVETFTAKRAYEIAAEYRKRGVKVIMGGMHVNLIPEEVSLYADSIFLGDAETKWGEVIQDARNNKLKSVYKGEFGVIQPSILPRRDLFKGKGYLPLTLIQFSRGCTFNCNFCATSAYFNSCHYIRKIDEVLKEIEVSKKKFYFFVDDNIIANKKAAKELFRALIPMKIKWVSQGSIDMTQDKELLDLMIRSGCLGTVIGFESINKESLKFMNKIPNFDMTDQYKEQIEILRHYGLQTWAAFTLGHDTDTLDTIKRTVEFALENKFAFAAFNILTPYPGTPLYDNLRKQNRLLYDDKWWIHKDYRFNYATFKPKNMTPDQLTEACFKARSDFNSPMSIFKRAFDFKTNMRTPLKLGVYLAYNPLFRKEVFKKQGLQFGLED